MLLVLLLTVAPLVAAQSDYCSFTPSHTLCNPKGLGPRCGSQIPVRGVSKQDAAVILAQHNKLRDLVARGQEARGAPGPQPPAANMRLMEYDDELARVAQGHADQCIFDHECRECRRVSRFDVGQNLFTSFQSFFDPTIQWERAIQAWYDEVALVNPAIISPFRFMQDLGHYTQMMWWSTWKVGCGFTMYKEGAWWKKLYTCDYGPGGNIIFGQMYLTGSPCSSCPDGTTCSRQYPGLCEVPGDGDESTDTDVTTAPATSSTLSNDTSTSAPNTTFDSNELDNKISIIPSADSESRTPSDASRNGAPSGNSGSRSPGNRTSGDNEGGTPPRRPQNGGSNRIPLLTLSGDGSILPVLPGRGKGDQELDFNLLIEFFNSVRRRPRARQDSSEPNNFVATLSNTAPRTTTVRTNSSENLNSSNPSSPANPVPAPNSTEPPTQFTEPLTHSTEPTTPLTEPTVRSAKPSTTPTPSSVTSDIPNTTTPITTTPAPLPAADNSSSTPEETNRGQRFNSNNRFRPVPSRQPTNQGQEFEAGQPEQNSVPTSGEEPNGSNLLPFLNRNGPATKVITTNSFSSVHSILSSLPPGLKPIVLFRSRVGQLTELDPHTLSPVRRQRRSISVGGMRVPGTSLLLRCDLDARPCAFEQIGANWTLASSDTQGQYTEVQLSSGQLTQLLVRETVPSPPSEALCVLLHHRRTFTGSGTNATNDRLPTVKVGVWQPRRQLLQKAAEEEEGAWEVSSVTLTPVKGPFVLFLQVEANNAPSRVAFNELVVMDGSC